MKDSKRSSDVSCASGANLRRVKAHVLEDCRIKVGVKLKTSNSSAIRSKNHLAWYVSLNAKPSEEKFSCIPRIKWKCPPKFVLDLGWRVASGEGSLEVDAQKHREKTVIEAVYPHRSAIPLSPSISPVSGDEYYSDCQIPIVPIIPIEESTAVEMSFETSSALNNCINSQLPCPFIGRPTSGNPTISLDSTVDEKYLLNILRDLEGGDLAVAAAAAAAVAAVMERKQDIDTELLIKCLSDPVMIKKVIDENRIGTKPGPGIISYPNCSTSSSSLNSTLGSVVDIPSPETMKQSLPMPTTEVETVINNSATKQGETATHAGQALVCMPKPVRKTSPPPNCQARLIKNLTSEARQSTIALSGIRKTTSINHAAPLIPSTLHVNEDKIVRMINDYGVPDSSTVKPPAPIYASIAKPGRDPLMPLINEHQAPIFSGTLRSYGQERNEMISAYRVTMNAGSNPCLVSNPLMHASNTLANALKSNFNSTEENVYYCKSLIKNHGEKQVTGVDKFPNSGQPFDHFHGLRLTQNTDPYERIDPRYQKPCMFFNSSKGCRSGSNCPYIHDMPGRRMTGVVMENLSWKSII